MADIKIYGTLKNATESGKVAYASQVFDEEQEKFQSEINKEIKSPVPPKLRIAHWNVGGFSLGSSGDPTITPSDLDEMSMKWRVALNGLGADILCCCEYNTNFMDEQSGHDAVLARSEVFNDKTFKYAEIGPQLSDNHYMQTAIFGNLEMKNKQTVTYPQTTQSGRYYEVVDVMISGKVVKVVATHLDFNQGSTEAQKEQSHQNRISQINKLIADFGGYPYVIMCADYNIGNINITDYDLFSSAGFSMLNVHGYLGQINTQPAGSPTMPLDNIIYKGFVSQKIGIIDDATISDHAAIFAELTMIL